jgi:diguanylate cyclase (GGDEF)-like protein
MIEFCKTCETKYCDISTNKLYKLELKNFIIEWVLLVIIFFFIAIALTFNLYYNYKDTMQEEKFKLTTHSKIVHDSFFKDIDTISDLLYALSYDIKDIDLQNSAKKEKLLQHFEFINLILPNLSAIKFIDKDGMVQLSSKRTVLELDYSNMEFFKTIKEHPQDKLYLSHPYNSPLGVWAVNLSLMLKDKNNNFDGVLVAVLDSSKLIQSLQTALYSDNMNGTLLDFDGNIFLTTPTNDDLIVGKNINSPKYLFYRHINSKRTNSCFIDYSKYYNKDIFVTFYNITSDKINQNKGLILAMSRDKDVVFKEFYSIANISIWLYLFVLFITSIRLYFSQNKRNTLMQQEYRVQEYYKKSLESKVNIDGLTNIPNRRSFDNTLDIEWRDVLRNRLPISLLFIDIDFFKNYNDTYGHQQGDECLKTIAKALQNSLNRARDFVSRYGGEEFICILPNTQKEGAINKAEELRAKIEALNIEHKSSTISDVVTISIGVSTIIPDETNDPKELIKKADNALYLSKERGRNRVSFYD